MTHLDDSLFTPEMPEILKKFVREYYQLASLPELSDRDTERMSAILEFAEFDDELNKWINKVDQQIESQENN